MEKVVNLPDEIGKPSTVIVRVHNTAPDIEGCPTVHFKSVTIESSHGNHSKLGELPPGESRETTFEFHPKQLIGIEFTIHGELDTDRLFKFSRRSMLPEEVIAPLKREFVERLESIGVKKLVNDVLAAIGTPDPNMTLGDISRIRKSVKQETTHIEEKREAIGQLFSDSISIELLLWVDEQERSF